jgi:hypothetical protein
MKYLPVIPTVHICTPCGMALPLTDALSATVPREMEEGVGYAMLEGPVPRLRFPSPMPRL